MTMGIGTYTFAEDPDRMDLIDSKKAVAVQETYGGVAVFQWDALVAGIQIVMEWDWITDDMYDDLRDLYLETAEQEWDTDGATAVDYNVLVIDLEGKYVESFLDAFAGRKDVKMTLLIMSEVSS